MLLGIYGSGGLGMEIEELAKIINEKEKRWERIIFIDDTKEKADNEKIYPFEAITALYSPDELECVIAVGEPVIRELLYNKVKEKGYDFAVLIHPYAFVASDVRVGKGSVICYNAYISIKSVLSENVLIQPMAALGHGCRIGRNSIVSSFASMGGNSSLGDNSYIALNACVKEQTKIGSGSVIGMASAVVHDIPDGVLAVGYPARPIKNENVRVFEK